MTGGLPTTGDPTIPLAVAGLGIALVGLAVRAASRRIR